MSASAFAARAAASREAGIAVEAGHRLRQRGPVRLTQARERDPTVARAVEAVERPEAGLLMVAARPLGPAVGPDPRVGVEVHAGVHDRRVDPLALAGALAPVQRHQHRERRLHRAPLVAHAEAVPVGRVALAAELELEAARRLCELVEPGPGGTRPVVAPHRRVAVDDRGVELPGRLVVDPEPLGHAGTHVVVDDVDLADQPVRDLATLGRLEVDDDVELPALASVERLGDRTHLIALGRLELVDGRAEVAQQHRPERAGEEVAEVEDLDALQSVGQRSLRGAHLARTARRTRQRPEHLVGVLTDRGLRAPAPTARARRAGGRRCPPAGRRRGPGRSPRSTCRC